MGILLVIGLNVNYLEQKVNRTGTGEKEQEEKYEQKYKTTRKEGYAVQRSE